MTYSPALQLAAAQADLGYREYGNNCQKFSQWQSGITCQQGGWCVSAASYWAYQGGMRFGDATFGDKGCNGTWAMEAWGRKHGLARDPRNYTAQPGDLICVRGAIHTSTCVHDEGGMSLVTIDGNTSNMVAYRLRYRSTVEMVVALTALADVAPPTLAQIKAQHPKSKGHEMFQLFRIPDADTQRERVWVTNGIHRRALDHQDEVDVLKFIAGAQGLPTNVGTIPKAVASLIPIADVK